MANFENAVQWVLWQEDDRRILGKIVDLGDGAGLTRLGVTQKNYGQDVPANFFTDLPFVDAVQAAKDVYRQFYWNSIAGEALQSDQIAAMVLSFAINKNVRTAVRALQMVVGSDQDGVMGPITVATVNSKDPDIVVKLFRAEWLEFYQHLADVNPDKLRFLPEWQNRANTPYPNPLVRNTYA